MNKFLSTMTFLNGQVAAPKLLGKWQLAESTPDMIAGCRVL